MVANKQDKLVHVGALRGPHGLKGLVKAKLTLDDPQLAVTGGPLYAADGRAFKVMKVQQAGQGLLALTIDGVGTPEQAEALKGVAVYLDRTHWPEDPVAVYLADIAGAHVVAEDGTVLGTVGKSIELPAGPALEVARVSDGKTVILPLEDAFVAALGETVDVTDLGAQVLAL